MPQTENNELRQKCIDMWQWIVDHPGSGKKDWKRANPELALEVRDVELCFACLHVETLSDESCAVCPLGTNGCGFISGYGYWCENSTQKNAQVFLNYIKENWKED